MNLIQLDKRSARKLELESKPIEEFFVIQPKIELICEEITGWQTYQNLNEYEPQKHVISKLTEIFNTKQSYNVKYENRNAVWCFEWKGENEESNKFVVYQSIQGISLKLHKDFNKNKIVEFLNEFRSLLFGEDSNNAIVS